MLKIKKETLTELTSDQMAGVVGGTVATIAIPGVDRSCVVGSCITGGETSTYQIYLASNGC